MYDLLMQLYWLFFPAPIEGVQYALDPATIAIIGSAAWNAINSARNQGKSDELNTEALNLARDDYNSRGPLRDMFLNNVTQPIGDAPDLSAVFADPSNPFYRGGQASPQGQSQLDFGDLAPPPARPPKFPPVVTPGPNTPNSDKSQVGPPPFADPQDPFDRPFDQNANGLSQEELDFLNSRKGRGPAPSPQVQPQAPPVLGADPFTFDNNTPTTLDPLFSRGGPLERGRR